MLQNWLKGEQDCGNCPRTWDALLTIIQNVVGSQASAVIKEILNWDEEEGEATGQRPAESECVCSFICVLWIWAS